MKKGLIILIGIMLLVACAEGEKTTKIEEVDLTKYVNPFVGTDGPGNTYPGATVPFGMVQLSPDIGIPGWDRIAGYYYQDSIISGFSHMHLTGTGAGDLYDILVMPTNSKFDERIEANNGLPFSKFSHDKEEASPGYYAVDLLDYQIKAELTATARTGIHRYNLPKDDHSQIHIDLGYALNWDAPTDTYIKVVDSTKIEGYRMSTGWAKDQRVFFAMEFSKPFVSYKLWQNDESVQVSAKAKKTEISLKFETKQDTEVVLKTGLSTANIEGAWLSINKEAPHFNFDTYKKEAQKTWQNQLKKINIQASDSVRAVFYTMLYQSMLAPTLLSDHNGAFKGANDTIGRADFDRYDTFSLWDTYRAAHPLYTIVHPNRVSDFIKSMLMHYQETGLLPVWSMQGNETNMMIGYHAVPVVVDAYFKGIPFDAQLAYQACKASAMANDRQIDVYKEMGYIPIDEEHENWSVSKTLEYAYDDWCIAQMAKDLGFKDDYNYFLKRSENWRNVYDKSSSFMRPKHQDGSFLKSFIAKAYSPYFCESNAWHYVWNVPQNIEGLIKTMGGSERFEQKLDSMFSYDPLPEDKLPIFSTGMIGQYAHGNEPSHHVAYLYHFINKPDKVQELVRTIMKTQYSNTPNGHCGNEDCGQMSSWYVFNALGIYPVNPAQGIYQFGSSLVDKAEVKLENGNQFVLTTENNSEENKYIQQVKFNNKPYHKNYITHRDIMAGGKLTFVMGANPNQTWFTESAISSKIYN